MELMSKSIGKDRDELKSKLEETYFLAKEQGVYEALDEAMKIVDDYVKLREDAVRESTSFLNCHKHGRGV